MWKINKICMEKVAVIQQLLHCLCIPDILSFHCFSSLFNRAAMGRARFLLCTGFFFFRFRVTRRRPPRMNQPITGQTPTRSNVVTELCHHQPITDHFSALFLIPPLRKVLSTTMLLHVFEKIMLLMNFYFATSYSH